MMDRPGVNLGKTILKANRGKVFFAPNSVFGTCFAFKNQNGWNSHTGKLNKKLPFDCTISDLDDWNLFGLIVP